MNTDKNTKKANLAAQVASKIVLQKNMQKCLK